MKNSRGHVMVRLVRFVLLIVGVLVLASPSYAQAGRQRDIERTIADYRLGAGDKVHITVFGEDSLTGDYFVGSTGSISFPLTGDIQAGGLTIPELQDRITASLKQGFLLDPKVSAEVLVYRPFYILGEVQKPGEYPYETGLTVQKAVAAANGFTYRANKRTVFIKRDGESVEQPFPLDSSTLVAPGDTIRIGERYF